MVHKYDKIYNLDRYDALRKPLINFEIKEKLDGTNFRFTFNSNGDVVFGTRNVWDIEGTPQAMGYQQYIDFIKERVMKVSFDVRREWNHEVFIGEAMGKGKLKYKLKDDQLFIGFDVYSLSRCEYRANWKECFERFNLPTVDIFSGNYFDLTPNEIAELIEKNEIKSSIDNETVIEGVVMVDYEKQAFYKVVRQAFRETKRSSRKRLPAVELFYDIYFTPNRIDKIMNKMLLDGDYNGKNPLPSVLAHVIMDVMSEASPKDLYKAFAKDLQPLLLATLMPDYLVRIQELAEQKSEE